MLKHIGPNGIDFLTATINLLLSSLGIPSLWKVGRVIPIIKLNKPVDQSKSYRQISLLSPVAKLLESLLLPTMTDHLTLAFHQHGFRKGHSTTTALHLVLDAIQFGLNQRKPKQRLVLVALDLSSAFDTVSHSALFRNNIDKSRKGDFFLYFNKILYP